MKKLLVFTLGVCIMLGVAGMAEAIQISFDDMTPTHSYWVDDGYGGIDWTNIGYVQRDQYPGSGYQNGIYSGDYAAAVTSGSLSLVDGGTFDFNGTYLTSAWYDNNVFTIAGYLDGALVGAPAVIYPLNTDGYTYYDFSDSFNGIDTLMFTAMNWHVAIDDLEIVPNPEPATLFLLGIGLTAIAGFGRKKLKVR